MGNLCEEDFDEVERTIRDSEGPSTACEVRYGTVLHTAKQTAI